MYVIFPAEDVVEFTIARPPQPRFQHCSCHCIALQKRATSAHSVISPTIKRSSTVDQTCAISSADINGNTNTNTKTRTATATATSTSTSTSTSTTNISANFADCVSVVESQKKQLKNHKTAARSQKSNSEKHASAETACGKMSTVYNEPSLKDLSHPSFNEPLKAYNTTTFKLVKTVSDFSQELSRAYEEHSNNLQQIVTNYRKKNAELRKERPSCQGSLFHIWESLLQEVEVDSQAQGDIANVFTRQVSRPLLDRSFHRKVQARKIFGHRDSFEIIINKAEEKLAKCRQEYKAAYLAHLSSPNSSATLSSYIEAHNTYVRQLHATNGMVEQYSKETLPALLQELEDVYSDLYSTVSDSVLQGAESVTSKSADRMKRYENISSLCRSILPNADVAYFIKCLSPLPNQPHPSHRLRVFVYPISPQNATGTAAAAAAAADLDGAAATASNSEYISNAAEQMAQMLPKNELVTDYLSASEVREKHDTLKAEAIKLEAQIKQLQDSLDTLLRIQQRSLESSLFNKVNELQEDISIKRYDLRMAQIQLAAVRAQKELFSVKLDNLEANSRDRKLSAISNASMKSKWLKAFKSLKTSVPSSNGSTTKDADKKSGKDGFQVTNSPDLVHQFQEYTYKKITPCDVCSQVLRGHTRQGLKCRLCKMNVHLDCQERVTTRCQTKSRLLRRQKSTSEIETRIVAAMPEEEAPHSPRRHKINWRMKSVSLDSSDPPDFCQPKCSRSVVGSAASVEPHSNHSSSSRLQSPSSPVHNRRLLSARPMRMSSVELPDDTEKSPSSASNSPIPSPSPMKPQRLLPTNLYVVLYNFKARHTDELDLKAGYKVTVIDTSDHDWWKGKCLGRVGFFPSKYVTKLQSGERVLQVTHNLQVSAADNTDKGITLLRDQIVIQVGEDIDGMIMFRNGDNQQGVCPLEFLQEV